ncbi:MAG: nucleoside hydrolase, partial [Clostridium sp.]
MKRKVIIDCDPGIDDALALILALNSPELEILGITIVSGNVNSRK